MRTAHFTDGYKPMVNGVTASIDTLTSEMAARGHRSIILSAGCPAGLSKDGPVLIRRFCGPRFPPYPDYVIAAPGPSACEKVVSRFGAQLVHVHTPFGLGLAGASAAKRLGLPCVGTFHTLFPKYLDYVFGPLMSSSLSGVFEGAAWSYLRWFYSRCAAVSAPSKAIGKELRRIGLKNVRVIPTGVNTGRFAPRRPRHDYRKGLGTGKMVLSLSRIGFEKNLPFLISLFERIDATLVIAGRGPALASLKERVKEKGLGKRVRFLGFLSHEEVVDLYNCCDVFAMPSKTETQGLTVLEAMACGRPVVVFRGASAEFVRDGESGIVASSDEDFESAIEEVLSGRQLRTRMGRCARQSALKNSSEAFAKRTEEMYRGLLG